MAEIRPFRAWRYHSKHTAYIDKLVSPLFDVISEKQRKQLYNEHLNSMHLSVPLGEKPASQAKNTLSKWIRDKDLVQDKKSCIYVYYQYFYLPNDPVKHCRKGFICMIRAYDYKENIILRHENTMPGAVNDRVDILNSTQLNVSPTHGLYTDSDFELEPLMDKAMENPLYKIEDYQGVTDAFALINQEEIVARFIKKLADKPVILADGHHRYESSLQYAKEKRKGNKDENAFFNFHMMYLTNTEADNLRILPTHRLIKGLPNFNTEALLRSTGKYFKLKEIEEATAINEVILGKKWSFGMLLKNRAFIIRLREPFIHEMPWKFPQKIKELDLTVLHYFFIEKVLGIRGKEQRKSRYISFERNFVTCYNAVNNESASMALITNEISIDQVKEVCYSGFTLPQKSTYFYPKVICGFLFGSLIEVEE